MDFFSKTKYIINKNNLLYNLKYIKSKLKQGVKLCAVVKADAYGLGMEKVCGIIKDEVDHFAVANLNEGIRLRHCLKDANIMVLGPINFNYLEYYCDNFLSPTVSTISDIRKLSRKLKKPIKVQFGLNTGMNRIGFLKKSDILMALDLKNKNENIEVNGVFSHFATKENDVDFMRCQKIKFDELLEFFSNEKIIRHISNSNATLNHKEFNYDMVRVGFSMYGMTNQNLKEVVSIETQIIHINHIKRGDSVGYDRIFVAEKNKKIAVIPIGYYDGFARGLSGRGKVLVNGEYAKVVGRVCMDMAMIDVTDIRNVRVGTKVVIIGKDRGRKITLTDHAKILKTSEYEVLARFNNSRMNVIIQ